MGQAKRRGTFEDRKTQAIENERLKQEELESVDPPKSRANMALLAMLALVPQR